MAADPCEVFSHSLSTTAPTMSVGSLGNPHATGRKAAHPWDPRVSPLSAKGKSARIALPIAASFSHI